MLFVKSSKLRNLNCNDFVAPVFDRNNPNVQPITRVIVLLWKVCVNLCFVIFYSHNQFGKKEDGVGLNVCMFHTLCSVLPFVLRCTYVTYVVLWPE